MRSHLQNYVTTGMTHKSIRNPFLHGTSVRNAAVETISRTKTKAIDLELLLVQRPR